MNGTQLMAPWWWVAVMILGTTAVEGCSFDALGVPSGAVVSGAVGCAVGQVVTVNGTCVIECTTGELSVGSTCLTTGWTVPQPCGAATGGGSSSGMEPWVIVIIVISVLLLVAIGMGIVMYFCLNRREQTNGDDVAPPQPAKCSSKSPPPPPPRQKPPPHTSREVDFPEKDKNGLGKEMELRTPETPLISALKGSPKPPNRHISPYKKRYVTFSNFHPGDVVQVRYDSDYHLATIQSHNPNGTYTVLWHPITSLLTSTGISPAHIRPLHDDPSATSVWSASYAGGSDYDYRDPRLNTPIMCLWEGSWHQATLEGVNDDGTYVIRWLDGTFTPNMNPGDTKLA